VKIQMGCVDGFGRVGPGARGSQAAVGDVIAHGYFFCIFPSSLFKTPVFQSNLSSQVQNAINRKDLHVLKIDLPTSDSKIGQELMAREAIRCWRWIYHLVCFCAPYFF
jgi:hypothetical protein